MLIATIVAVPKWIGLPQFCVREPALLRVVHPLDPVLPKLGITSDSPLGEGQIYHRIVLGHNVSS